MAKVPGGCAPAACAMLTAATVETTATSLAEPMEAVARAASELQGSATLREALLTVLQLGNYLNGGSARGGAAGFRLDCLGMLKTVHSSDGKITLLHIVAQSVSSASPSKASTSPSKAPTSPSKAPISPSKSSTRAKHRENSPFGPPFGSMRGGGGGGGGGGGSSWPMTPDSGGGARALLAELPNVAKAAHQACKNARYSQLEYVLILQTINPSLHTARIHGAPLECISHRTHFLRTGSAPHAKPTVRPLAAVDRAGIEPRAAAQQGSGGCKNK